ncbi:LuxR C-terminal-related transcriptional regulator (plasmid) [Streptomyces galilaeus]
MFPALGGVPGAQEPDVYALSRAVRALLEQLGARGGLLLVLDDAHRAGPEIAEFVEHLLRRPPAAPVLTVLVHRGGGPGARRLSASAGGEGGVRHLPLRPLGREAARGLLPGGLGALRRELVLRDGEGVPGLLLALSEGEGEGEGGLHSSVELGSGPSPLPSCTGALDLRVLTAPARRTARAAAELGDPFALEAVARTARLPVDEVLRAVDELYGEGIVRADARAGRFRFARPAVRALLAGGAGVRELDTSGGAPGPAAGEVASAVAGEAGARELEERARAMVFTQPARAARLARRAVQRPGAPLGARLLLCQALVLCGRLGEAAGEYARLWPEVECARRTAVPSPSGTGAAWAGGAGVVPERAPAADPSPGRDPGGASAQPARPAHGEAAHAGRVGCADAHPRPAGVLRGRGGAVPGQGTAAGGPVGLCAEAAVWRARALRLLGRRAEAWGVLRQARLAVPAVHAERAALLLEWGRPARGAALAAARRAVQSVPESDVGAYGHALALLAAAHACNADAGAARESAALAEQLLAGLGQEQSAPHAEAWRWLGEAAGGGRARRAAAGGAGSRLPADRPPGAALRCFRRGFDLALRLGQGHLLGRLALGTGWGCLESGRAADAADYARFAAEESERHPASSPTGYAQEIAELSERARRENAECEPIASLSRREREIALLVGPGLTNQEIATRLNLSVKTVETYMGRIFKKMGAKSRAHVAFLMSEPAAGGTRN